jgi:hypothetical protein
MGSFLPAVSYARGINRCGYKTIQVRKMGSFGIFFVLKAGGLPRISGVPGMIFVLRYTRRKIGAAWQRARDFILLPNRYTSFHRAGFSTFYLRGKTYGNVLVGSGWWEARLSFDFEKNRVGKST